MCSQSSKLIRATSATRPIVSGAPTNGTNDASPMTMPHMMALGKPSKASAPAATTATQA